MDARIATGLERARFELRSRLAAHPALFLPLLRFRRRYREVRLDRRTEVVLEGFPRSGNTFAYAAFEVAQGRPVRAARHTHSPAVVRRAVERGVPVMLLIRTPRDAALSVLSWEPRLSAAQIVRAYLRFYGAVRPAIEGCVVATFEQVTGDFGAAIERLNARFGTSFRPFTHRDDELRRATEIVERLGREESGGELYEHRVSRPSAERKALQEALAPRMTGPRVTRLLARAEELYDEIARLAETT